MRSSAVLATCLLACLAAGSAWSAPNTVPGSRITRFVAPITTNTLKPAACSAIALTVVVAGVTGTNAADLLLGTAGPNSMFALGGNDCVLGGGGNDTIVCGAGAADIALGGPGTDTFNASCETQIQ